MRIDGDLEREHLRATSAVCAEELVGESMGTEEVRAVPLRVLSASEPNLQIAGNLARLIKALGG